MPSTIHPPADRGRAARTPPRPRPPGTEAAATRGMARPSTADPGRTERTPPRPGQAQPPNGALRALLSFLAVPNGTTNPHRDRRQTPGLPPRTPRLRGLGGPSIYYPPCSAHTASPSPAPRPGTPRTRGHPGPGVFDDKWQNFNPRRRLVIEWTTQL